MKLLREFKTTLKQLERRFAELARLINERTEGFVIEIHVRRKS